MLMMVTDRRTMEVKTYFLSELVSHLTGDETWLELEETDALESAEDASRPKTRLPRKGSDE